MNRLNDIECSVKKGWSYDTRLCSGSNLIHGVVSRSAAIHAQCWSSYPNLTSACHKPYPVQTILWSGYPGVQSFPPDTDPWTFHPDTSQLVHHTDYAWLIQIRWLLPSCHSTRFLRLHPPFLPHRHRNTSQVPKTKAPSLLHHLYSRSSAGLEEMEFTDTSLS